MFSTSVWWRTGVDTPCECFRETLEKCHGVHTGYSGCGSPQSPRVSSMDTPVLRFSREKPSVSLTKVMSAAEREFPVRIELVLAVLEIWTIIPS